MLGWLLAKKVWSWTWTQTVASL